MTPHVVYRFFARDGALLYVGCSKNLRQRIATNHIYMHWWPDAYAYTVEHKARRPRKAVIRAARALVQQPHRRAVTPRPQS